MPANTTELFPIAPQVGACQAGAATYTDRTGAAGAAGLVDLVRGRPHGTPITRLSAKAVVAVTDGVLRFFVYDGNKRRLRWEIPITATPLAAGYTETWDGEIDLEDFILPEGHIIQVGMHNAELVNVFADGLTYESGGTIP